MNTYSWVYQLIKRYFSPTVVGLENIPDEPTLFAGRISFLYPGKGRQSRERDADAA